MKIFPTIAELRHVLDEHRAAGRTIGFVPTMGALHDGHLSLIRRARDAHDVVVISVFVNPIQFNEASDLAAYPRNLDNDAHLAGEAGADLLFAPDVEEMYPAGFQTAVLVRELTTTLEGASRGAAHFEGVTTVVAKLLNIVQPAVAYFGQKDAQQAIVVRRMVRDLAFRAHIEICPTVREPDGLAMSSRNVRLDAQSRKRALALKAGLDAACERIECGESDARVVERAGRDRMTALGVEPEYFAVVSSSDLSPVASVEAPVLIAVAARVGPVRLIDNVIVVPARNGAASSAEAHQ
jgi:pantoate--beta-alanine ligase